MHDSLDMLDTVDTVIVGAGLAGLTAAHLLTDAGQTVRVFEADNEVGGRTRTRRLESGALAELGGEWVGPHHRHLLQLVADLGLHVRPAGQLGHPVLWRGTHGDHVSRFLWLSPSQEWALLRTCWRLNQLGREIDPVHPWLSPGAEELDAVTIDAWLRDQGIGGDALHHLANVLGALLSAQIEDVSLLHLVWWVARGGGVARLVRTTFAYNLVEGAQDLALRLAANLDEGVIRLRSPVQRISETDHVEVTSSTGEPVRAQRCVVTAPVGALGKIEFTPPLPLPLARLDELRGRPGTKVSALLPEGHRVRHRAAVSGKVLAAAWRVDRRVTAFTGPAHEGADEAMLVEELAEMFRCRARELRSPMVHRWSHHAYIPGCDIGFAPGQLTRHGPHLTRPHGNVHFAGSERSSWPNNMEGAVESATRVAQEILTT